jgi:flagellar assembly factor FliW
MLWLLLLIKYWSVNLLIQTTRFGELECKDVQVIVFSKGLPGFLEYKKYMIVEIEDSPFQYLQSIDEASLAFIITSPFDFFPEYEFELSGEVMDEMNIRSSENIQVYNIVNVQGELSAATMNLAAPIIINKIENTGIQHILPNSIYSIYQPLFAKTETTGGE